MATAWHHFIEPMDSSLRGSILRALADARIKTSLRTSEVDAGPGVIFFDRVDPNLCDFVSRASRHGLERVLAVGVSGSSLGGETWRLLASGASDVFVWNHFCHPTEEIKARFERWRSIDETIDSPLVRETLVGRNPAWICVLRQITEIARYTDASVLITGESGTGKELVARLIHTLDPRPEKQELVLLDCTTVVPELSGSEFFGHERGAFTGAVAARDGAFAIANRGTLFLDEIGELPLGLQAELLRVVQEQTYKRLGSNTWQQTNFRLICATNKDLQQEGEHGRFRRDLYYRMATCTCALPPLRERTDDILTLAHHFLEQISGKAQTGAFDPEVCEYLLNRKYPGNVRDLRQVVSRMTFRHVGPGPITAGDIPREERPQSQVESQDWRDGSLDQAIRYAVALGVGLKEMHQAVSDAAVQIAVAAENGNLQRAARRLGVTPRALQLRRASQRNCGHPQGLGQGDK
jgi:transcriptional regulator with GAF, ATPase, and Fis domain